MVKRLSAMFLAATLCLSGFSGNLAYAAEVAGTETTEVTTTETTEELSDDYIIPNDETGIPDAVLYQYLVNAKVYKGGEEAIADANGDGKLSVGEAKAISSLQLYEIEGDEDRIRSFKNVSEYVPNFISFVCYDYADTPGEHTKLSTADMEEFAKLQEKNGRFGLTLRGVLFENPEDLVKLKLNGIDITDSNLTNVDFITKENFPNCEYIDLSGNKLDGLPASIGEMTDLYNITVSNCGLTELPDISGLTGLTNLDVSNNELTALPDISGLTNLERLYADRNQLTSLPDISGLVNLETLYIRDNQLTTLPDLTALTKLSGEYGDYANNLLTEAELKAKLPAQYTDDDIKKIVEAQTMELACTVSVDKTKMTDKDTLTVTVTIKNKCVMDLPNVKVGVSIDNYLSVGTAPEGYESDPVIESMKVGEELSFTYKVDGDLLAYAADPTTKITAYVQSQDFSNAYASAESEEIEVEKTEDDNSGSGSGSGDDYEDEAPLDLTVTEVTVSNNNIVVIDDEPIATVNISVTVTGADVEDLQAGDIMYINLSDGSSELGSRQLFYNAETKKFEGSVSLGGNSWKEGQYVIASADIIHNGYWYEAACQEGLNIWTYTNNTSDKVSPVLNKIQIFVNGVAQTGTTFKLKQGDTVTVRADVTEDSQVTGTVMIYPDFEAFTSEQMSEMLMAGVLNSFELNATEYDLEGEKTMGAPLYEGEYFLYVVIVTDKYANSNVYYGYDYMGDTLTPLYGEVGKNPANAGLVESEATNTTLNSIASNITTVIAKDGAVNATTKANIEAAIKNGDKISVDLSISNVPANSVNSKVKEDVQKKADGVFGENTKLLYLDITMDIYGDKSGKLGSLSELDEELSITVTLPQELQGDYYYKVVRYHEKADGTVETTILDAVKNADGTLTFQTDRFSTYAIAYSTTATKTTETPTSPDTSDGAMAFMYFGLAVTAMTAVVVSKKRGIEGK